MTNMDLYCFLESLNKKIIDKYKIKSLKLLLSVDETEEIDVSFNLFEFKKINVEICNILDYIIKELENNNLKYKNCFNPPNCIYISDYTGYSAIENETTVCTYCLIKDKK